MKFYTEGFSVIQIVGEQKKFRRKGELRKRDRTQVTDTLSDEKNRQSKTDKYPRYGARLVSLCLRYF